MKGDCQVMRQKRIEEDGRIIATAKGEERSTEAVAAKEEVDRRTDEAAEKEVRKR
ncbi:hypothetical protein Ddye_025487 [Dipteronia dyeriana]|uniref:Uncharacterized protein n=1 Tax=Dipteronia dyeriana TaxID=168575 RepID=A0AAD9TKY8_9ROSI|nr:hypothetical protein Ddye_025487 [Dipteronia dyeriana]